MTRVARTVIGQITDAKFLNNSVNGNPRYVVAFQGHDKESDTAYMISSDASCSYDVENCLPRPHLNKPAPIVVLGLTRADRIVTITPFTD